MKIKSTDSIIVTSNEIGVINERRKNNAGDKVNFFCETRLGDGTLVQGSDKPISGRIEVEETIKDKE